MSIEEQMVSLVGTYGTFGLFALSFLAATLIPLSSEAALWGGIALGIPSMHALIACSAGNCLACGFNYGLGVWAREKTMKTLTDSRFGLIALRWLERYGTWSLLLSWTPFLGDPLTLVAGIVRVPILRFTLLVFSLRIARYVLLLYFVN